MRVWALHLVVLGAVLAASYALPPYLYTNLARIMVLAVFAMGYNIAFGVTGLLSLGHALFFAGGMYATGMLMSLHGVAAAPALAAGLAAGGALAAAVGVLALRTGGVAFMIVTLMFAQAGYLAILYFGAVTGGDEGFVIAQGSRNALGFDLSADTPRFLAAFGLFSVAMVANLALVRSRLGQKMVAMRENEERSRMLGMNPFAVKLAALVISGLYSGASGATYGVLFGYVGASFAAVPYSILPMLYVLMGGAGTVLGPFLGALLMFSLIEAATAVTTAHQALVGAALLVLILFAPKGLLGTLRERVAPWLP